MKYEKLSCNNCPWIGVESELRQVNDELGLSPYDELGVCPTCESDDIACV